MKNTVEKGNLPWDFFDATFCTADESPVPEAGRPPVSSLDEVRLAYVDGAEVILRDLNVLKTILGELRYVAGIENGDVEQTEADERAEAEEQMEEVLQSLVQLEEMIRDTEQIISDLTFVGLDESEALKEFTHQPGEFAREY